MTTRMGLAEAAQLLGVDLPVSPETVLTARRRQARLWHPDRYEGDERVAAFAADRMARINEAADRLLSAVQDGSGGSELSDAEENVARGKTSSERRGAPRPALDRRGMAAVAVGAWLVATTVFSIAAPLLPNLQAAYALGLIAGTLAACAIAVHQIRMPS